MITIRKIKRAIKAAISQYRADTVFENFDFAELARGLTSRPYELEGLSSSQNIKLYSLYDLIDECKKQGVDCKTVGDTISKLQNDEVFVSK
jgi:hypothetical protein